MARRAAPLRKSPCDAQGRLAHRATPGKKETVRYAGTVGSQSPAVGKTIRCAGTVGSRSQAVRKGPCEAQERDGTLCRAELKACDVQGRFCAQSRTVQIKEEAAIRGEGANARKEPPS